MGEAVAKGNGFIFNMREVGGAFGDLGTLLPLLLGMAALSGLSAQAMLLGFAIFYIATALHYRLPIPVQPMKAIAAIALTTGITPEVLAATGVLMGAILLILAGTGWIARLAKLVPQSVLAGLQLGLGVSLAVVAWELMGTAPWLAAAALALMFAMLSTGRQAAAPCGLALALLIAQFTGIPGLVVSGGEGGWTPTWILPGFADVRLALSEFVLPQLALTIGNAVILTVLVAGDYFGPRAAHVTPGRVAVTSGLANLLTAPFGAMPMCHGAGGIAAHHRFGARSGTAPMLLGAILGLLALVPNGLAVLAALPAAGLGALLFLAAFELAMSRRLYDSRPSCWPVIAVTAAATAILDPLSGLVAGAAAELGRVALLRRLGSESAKR